MLAVCDTGIGRGRCLGYPHIRWRHERGTAGRGRAASVQGACHHRGTWKRRRHEPGRRRMEAVSVCGFVLGGPNGRRVGVPDAIPPDCRRQLRRRNHAVPKWRHAETTTCVPTPIEARAVCACMWVTMLPLLLLARARVLMPATTPPAARVHSCKFTRRCGRCDSGVAEQLGEQLHGVAHGDLCGGECGLVSAGGGPGYRRRGACAGRQPTHTGADGGGTGPRCSRGPDSTCVGRATAEPRSEAPRGRRSEAEGRTSDSRTRRRARGNAAPRRTITPLAGATFDNG